MAIVDKVLAYFEKNGGEAHSSEEVYWHIYSQLTVDVGPIDCENACALLAGERQLKKGQHIVGGIHEYALR